MSEKLTCCDSLRYMGCGTLFSIDPAAKKWGLTILAIGVIVAGILGAVYGGCGLTSLPELNYLFAPLLSLSTGQIQAIIIGGVILSIAGMVSIYLLHRSTYVPPKVLAALSEVESHSEHFKMVKENLVYGCQDPYDFYYHLASVTEEVGSDSTQKEKWHSFLSEIHGKRLQCREGGFITVDCSYEFLRRERVIPEFTTEQIKKFRDQDKADIVALCACAFESFTDFNSAHFDDYFCKPNAVTYIVRQKEDDKLVGIIQLQEVETPDHKTSLYIHTLARQPNAVKLGITNKFREAILPSVTEKYEIIFCEVLKDNLTARRLYEGLGFQPVYASFFEDHLTMSLKDPDVLKKFSTV